MYFIILGEYYSQPYGSLSELELYIEQGRVCMSGVMNRQGLTEYPRTGVRCNVPSSFGLCDYDALMSE